MMQGASGLVGNQRLFGRYMLRARSMAFNLFGLSVAAVMLWAWSVREARYIEAESGWGYALGILGVSMMVLLLLYPLRKRLRVMGNWFSLAGWFRLHMLLGVLGPCSILLHSNFRLGSVNSTIALLAMLLVAGSGLVGRYFYGKFHHGIYGGQIRLREIGEDLDRLYDAVASSGDEQFGELYRGCQEILERQQRQISLRELLKQRRWLRRQMHQLKPALIDVSPLQDQFRALSALLERLAGLCLFERLFALWHVVHIPIFVLMVITAIIHVVVVHWY